MVNFVYLNLSYILCLGIFGRVVGRKPYILIHRKVLSFLLNISEMPMTLIHGNKLLCYKGEIFYVSLRLVNFKYFKRK